MDPSVRINGLILLVFISLAYLSHPVGAWDQTELEIFDLVEEINRNFYEVLDVPQNCSQSDIRRAYRRLSLQLHPDKNDAADAEEKFRQLVGIYEILKDESKRARYDQVLVDGLPNWRQPLYYYRRVRKMGTLEICTWVFVLFTIGQYAVAWASYFEKKLTMEEHVASKLKKMQRKAKKKKQNDISEEVLEEMEQLLTKPTFKNTLPFQFFNFIISLPSLCLSLKLMIEEIRRARQEKIEKEKEEAEELERLKKEIEEEKEREKERKSHRRKRILPDLSNEPEECILDAVDEPNQQTEATAKPIQKTNSGPWTDDDLADLSKYMKKFPVGSYERWEKIAEAMNRTVFEVTHFAKKVKENAYKPIEGEGKGEDEEAADRVEKKKEKTRGGKALKGLETIRDNENSAEEPVDGSIGWNQKQQKALETALAQYPKGSLERWERIAKVVPDKTKEECMLRVKYLSELVKKKKQMEQDEQLKTESRAEETKANESGAEEDSRHDEQE